MDGNKLVRYKTASTVASVFNAIGRSGVRSTGLLSGVITVLYKGRGGLPTPGSYRPITLLCTDYWLLGGYWRTGWDLYLER